MSQNRTRWDLRLEQLERHLRGGEFEAVRNALMAPDISRVPRGSCARLANLARRAQRPSLSLKLLQPIVRPKVKGIVVADREELLEYAYALQKVGAKTESFHILETLAPDYDKAHLALAFHHIFEWDYARALGHLEQLLGSPRITPYEAVVADVNRLACLVALKDERAETLFTDLERRIPIAGSSLLHGNILEIMAQQRLEARRVGEARVLLARAQQLMPEADDIYRMLMEKWSVIADAIESGRPDRIHEFRGRALTLQHWETLRDLDFALARLDPSSRWADWVYYGTPFSGFRRRLEDSRIFSETAWVSRHASPSEKWDPWFAPGGGGGGELMHRFVVLLLRDFYRPARIGEIFSHLFPDQYFDIEVSPNRIHQIASRARAWLEENQVPARLEEVSGSYCLRGEESLAILARKAQIRYTKVEFLFERYREGRPVAMSSREWADVLGFSCEKVKRLLREANSAGLVTVERKGPYSRYILKPAV